MKMISERRLYQPVFGVDVGDRADSEEIGLDLPRNREDADDAPRIRRDEMKLLSCPEEEVQVGRDELIHVFH